VLFTTRRIGERGRSNIKVVIKKKSPVSGALGAEDETRTRDPHLGKVMLYQLSYFCLYLSQDFPEKRCKNTLFLFSRQAEKDIFFSKEYFNKKAVL
jgi:hypothetical protein